MTRVLIIEDDTWLGESYARSLTADGFQAEHVSNPIDAMASIDAKLPDVIVLDVLLTAATAFTLLHELQSYGDTGAIPVVLCTNLTDRISPETVAPYGVVRILNKADVTPEQLRSAVRGALL